MKKIMHKTIVIGIFTLFILFVCKNPIYADTLDASWTVIDAVNARTIIHQSSDSISFKLLADGIELSNLTLQNIQEFCIYQMEGSKLYFL